MAVNTDKNEINEFLDRGVENVFPSKKFLEALLQEGKPLTMYLGIDPTGPTLHLGHAIILRKLRHFQELGHKAILLIGDFTGMIGDPTDKSSARIRLTREQVLKNAQRYKDQASKFISFSGKNKAEMKYNSAWLGKMSFEDVVELASHFTVQQMLERDMFQTRMKQKKPIYVHEFLYPLMQAYDCVAMNVDGEIGGNDQMFNMMAGRDLMKDLTGKEKFVITMKLLIDPTGKKMGKSENNMITFEDSSDEMFGKIMSWTDGMILPGFELLTDVSKKEIQIMQKEMKEGANPRDYKLRLAKELVAEFFDVPEADRAEERFLNLFKNKEIPEDIPTHAAGESANILDILVATKLASSKSEARRLIDGGGVKVDGHVIEGYDVEIFPGDEGVILQKGKRHFIKIVKK